MLDGKYEITAEREITPHSTLFGGTAPDGTAVQIVWYDLQHPDDERAFEGYRTALRALKRQGLAAVYDLVARPGAYYVAWLAPPGTARLPVAALDAATRDALGAALPPHCSLNDADIRSDGAGGIKLYGLPFALPSAALSPQRGVSPAETRTVTTPPPPARAHAPCWDVRPALLGLTLALTGCWLLLLSFYRTVQTATVAVPELRGEEVNRAAAALHTLGLAVAAIPVAHLDAPPENTAAGTVLELAPPAGTLLRPGRTVALLYAPPDNPSPQTVPELRGQSLAEAERTLAAQGLSVGDVARVYADAPLGTVLAPSPAVGAPAPANGNVALLVSNGPKREMTFLPDLTGLPLADALTLAQLAGLKTPLVERIQGSGRAPETVLAQNLPPLVPFPRDGAQLRLTVAGETENGALNVSGTPDLTGLSLTAAQRSARDLGARAEVAAHVSTFELPEGVVMQDPPPGSPLAERIALTVNVHPKPLPLPTPQARVHRGEVRRARYRWVLEPGITPQRATVTARTLAGDNAVVLRDRLVSGGDELTGVWLTTAPGPITFTLTLNGLPYGEPVTVNP
jgi:beta-lactam-binding protein with PASTA domain